MGIQDDNEIKQKIDVQPNKQANKF